MLNAVAASAEPMQRVCEPELMDDEAQARAYAAADFDAGDAAVVERILEACGAAGAGPLLVDLGCGPGNISFRLAKRCPDTAVLGLDGAEAMLAIARARQQETPQLWPNLQFRRLSLPLATAAASELGGRASAVVSNSLLHHLHDPAVLWRSVQQLASPGALVHVHDLRRPADAAALEQLVQAQAGSFPPILLRDYRASLQAAFRPAEVEAQLQACGLTGLRVRPVGESHLEVSGRIDTL